MGYKAIFKLKKMLEDNDIPFTFEPAWGGYRLVSLNAVTGEPNVSVIQNPFTCDSEEEEDGLDAQPVGDPIFGCDHLTAEEVFETISHYHRKVLES